MLRSFFRAFAAFAGTVSPTVSNGEAFRTHPHNRPAVSDCKEPHGAVTKGHEGAHQCLAAERAAVQYVQTGLRPADAQLLDQAFRVRYMRAVFAMTEVA